jgi:hypothetical protein
MGWFPPGPMGVGWDGNGRQCTNGENVAGATEAGTMITTGTVLIPIGTMTLVFVTVF